jgi:hypothetical protein
MSIFGRKTERSDVLTKRPDPIGGVSIPTIRNIEESAVINDEFQAVLTAGPLEYEVKWGHPNHRIWSFDDTEDSVYGPQLHQVEEMVFWGAQQDDLLVHCHAGMSRSTATAWGVCIAKGLDPRASLEALYNSHPSDGFGDRKRLFAPNPLLVSHLQVVFNDPTLMATLLDVLKDDNRASFWY